MWRVASSPLMQEVAWAAWEFAKAPAGDDLQVERAHIFLASYRDAGGPCREDEYAQAIPFIRLRLCDEIRRNLAAADRGEPWDRAYTEQEIRAFQALGQPADSTAASASRGASPAITVLMPGR